MKNWFCKTNSNRRKSYHCVLLKTWYCLMVCCIDHICSISPHAPKSAHSKIKKKWKIKKVYDCVKMFVTGKEFKYENEI